MRTYTLGEFACLTGKATSTLQRWDRTGVLTAHRTMTNRRYYTHDQYLSVMGLPPEPETTRGKRTVIYTRVSSRGRRGDLDNSDGTVFDNADTSGRIRKLERRKRRLERSLARSRRANQGKDKEHGWHNYRKILLRKRCVEQRLANIRTERMRRVCDELARRQPSSLTIEHLNVKGMMKNRHLAPALHKQALATFLELVEHTCHRHNIELRQVDRWYPSSRLCHECGWKNTGLTLNMRVWRCPMCGSRHDRDVNAALNLRDATEYQLI